MPTALGLFKSVHRIDLTKLGDVKWILIMHRVSVFAILSFLEKLHIVLPRLVL
jgi:hypothetical protein